MAFLNAEEREHLLNELKELSFNRAKAKLRRMDPKGRLAYLRNSQGVNRWSTRYELKGLGANVTLIEDYNKNERGGKVYGDFNLVEIVVEPTAENRT
jgi:hypothetical protein